MKLVKEALILLMGFWIGVIVVFLFTVPLSNDNYDEGFASGREAGLTRGFEMCSFYDLNTADHRLLRNGEDSTGLWCYTNPTEGTIESYATAEGYDVNLVYGFDGFDEYYVITKKTINSLEDYAEPKEEVEQKKYAGWNNLEGGKYELTSKGLVQVDSNSYPASERISIQDRDFVFIGVPENDCVLGIQSILDSGNAVTVIIEYVDCPGAS